MNPNFHNHDSETNRAVSQGLVCEEIELDEQWSFFG